MRLYYLLFLVLSVGYSQFNWIDGGLPIRQGVHVEWMRTAAEDDGTLIIVWSDTRNGVRDMYAQKITPDGNFLWGDGGALVAGSVGRQEDPIMVSDGQNGAYIIWQDYRDEAEDGDVYAQHLDSNGNMLWDPDGVPLSNQPGVQKYHNLCVDGNGGAYAVWADQNTGGYFGTVLGDNENDILEVGIGVPISTRLESWSGFSLEYAGAGEAVMTWVDETGNGYDIRAQRIGAGAQPLWTTAEEGGIVVCDAPDDQSKMKVTPAWTEMPNSDGQFDTGAIITWRDNRFDDDGDVYMQVLDQEGNFLFEENGRAVCDDPGQQTAPRVKTNQWNTYIVWEDKRNDSGDENVDIYAQKLCMRSDICSGGYGSYMWEDNGQPISTAGGSQDQVRLMADQDGVFFVWEDGRDNGDYVWNDIYLQHINHDSDNFSFSQNGIPIDTDELPQGAPLLKPDGQGGAYVVWADQKYGSDIGIDIQRVSPSSGAMWDTNGKLVWYGLDGNSYLSGSTQLEDGKLLVSWEDNRFFSTGHPGSFTYGLIVDSDLSSTGHMDSEPLSMNPYQGPHGTYTSRRAKTASNGENFLMGFLSADGNIEAYYQLVDENLNIMGNDFGSPVYFASDEGIEQRYYDITAIGTDYYIAFSDNREFAFNVYLAKVDGSGNLVWPEAIKVTDGLLADNIVRAVVPLENQKLMLLFESQSWMGIGVNAIIVDLDGQTLTEEINICPDCTDNVQYEDFALTSDGVVVTFKDSRGQASGVYAQKISFSGELLNSQNSIVISDVQNDQRNSAITYNSISDQILVCWNDARNESGAGLSEVDVICSTFENSDLAFDVEYQVSAISGSPQQNPSVYTSLDGIYMIAWEDMRYAAGIDQSANLSVEWDAFYQEIDLNGNYSYEFDGIPLCIEPFGQVNVQIDLLSEEDNTYLLTWEDDRSTGKALLTNIYAQSVSPQSSNCTVYDVSGDGNIDVLDVVQMVNIVLGSVEPTPSQECSGDINEDGNLDVLDVVQTVNYILQS